MEPDDDDLARRVAGGDAEALGKLFERHRDGLRRMIDFRLDARLRARLDASDVVQEVGLEAAARLSEYARHPAVPARAWLRILACQKLVEARRTHLGAQRRDARREQALPEVSDVDTSRIAQELSDSGTFPDSGVARREMEARLLAALDAMAPLDREVLVMRHFEQLSNADAAAELGISVDAASKRYLRALKRLEEAVS